MDGLLGLLFPPAPLLVLKLPINVILRHFPFKTVFSLSLTYHINMATWSCIRGDHLDVDARKWVEAL